MDILFPGACITLALWSWTCSQTVAFDSDLAEAAESPADDDDVWTGTGEDPGIDDEPFSHRGLLVSLATRVYQPAHDAFVTTADELLAATEYAAAEAATASAEAPTALEAARLAWRQAAFAWQRIELMQIGPAASSLADPGGTDLRDEVYSWPTVNTCRIDQEIVAKTYDDADFTQSQLVNVYGLDAIEYLLFHDSPENTCPPQVPINDGPWAALGDVELAARRAGYAAAITDDLVLRARQLRDAWAPTNGDFTLSLTDPGAGASPYENIGEVFDGVFRAMFYLDLMTKDEKLARPTGLDGTCPTASCPDRVESRWAHASRDHIEANLDAFEHVFYGGASPKRGMGFDDFLIEVGAADVADELARAIDEAQASVSSSTLPLAEAIATDNESVKDHHAAIKTVTDVLKGRFHIALNLTIPQEGAGDSD